MGKFVDLFDDDLIKIAKDEIANSGLRQMGVNVEVCGLKKSKKDVGIVVKGDDKTERVTNDPSLVFLALYEEAFKRVDDATKLIWIQNLLSQVSVDTDKDKIMITKPEINLSLGMYRKYGDVAVNKAELAIMTLAEIAREEKERKANNKKTKKNKK